ncbi:MAG: TonB-dependent receptor plug domain-containing protein, partial [bacterium]
MNHKKISGSFLVLLCLTLSSFAFAQDHKISGIVRDINTHKEISNVNIYMKGQQIGTTSDHAGRYMLLVRGADPKAKIVFQHIAYEAREITLEALLKMRYVYLQPRVIPLRDVTIEEEAIQRLEIDKDLPQAVSVVKARDFEIRGYVDAGDLLRNDQSVQVEEELSGKKTASIRGGNSDEVVVLYNDVKMNSAYDNVFDLSLIDLEDIERFEIIKGSNTALYGPEAFSGVINIVPKVQQDYNIRFQQRLGTYRSGNWGIHLYQKLDRIQGSYSYKRGGSKRHFIDTDGTGGQGLENKSIHHTANLNYSFSEHPDGRPANSLGAMWVSTSLDYDNLRDNEFLRNKQQLGSLKYTRESGPFKDFDVSLSRRLLDETQTLFIPGGNLGRSIKDQATY